MAVLGIQPMVGGGGYTMPTENAATIFGILAGVGNAVAGLIASENLTTIGDDRVQIRRLLPGLAVVAIGSVIGGLLSPGGSLSPF